MKTQEALTWWQQHSQRGGAEWAQRCLDSWTMPHRTHILTAVALIQMDGAIDSLFELGAASGPNLRLLRSAFPRMRLGGVDQFPMAGSADPTIAVGLLPHWLSEAPEADVYLSMYTLAYLDPDDVAATFLHLERLARRAIILCEPMPMPGQPEGQHRIDLPEYRHEYTRYTSWKTQWRWLITPMQDYLNTCLILRP